MATLLDYKNAVAAKGYEAVTTASAITAAINAARRRVVNARRWTFLEAAPAPLVTTAGAAGITVSAAWRIDAVRIGQGNSAWDLQYRPVQEVRRRQTEDTVPGTPRFWSKRAGQLIFYPIADGVYNVTVDYVGETLPMLVADADVETMFEDTFIDVIAWAAARELSFRMRDYNAIAAADSEYQTLLAALIRDDNTTQRQSARQVVQNPRRWNR